MEHVTKQVDTLRRYSTPVGTAWYFMNFFWRTLAIKTVGEKVYTDSLREFKVFTSFSGVFNISHISNYLNKNYHLIKLDEIIEMELCFISML